MKKNNKTIKTFNAFTFLELVIKGNKSFKNEHNFNEFLNLDLNVQNTGNMTPIMHILAFNKHYPYSLSPDQIMQICEKSDINIQDSAGWTYLFTILNCNKCEKLNLNNQQILSLLNKADLSILIDHAGYLQFILDNNKEENLGFTNQQLCELYDKTIQTFEYKNMTKEKNNFTHITKNYHKNFWAIYTAKKEQQKLNFIIKSKNMTKAKL